MNLRGWWKRFSMSRTIRRDLARHGIAPGPFRPFAEYHERLDRIVVLVKDGSICEVSAPLRCIVLLKDNHEGGTIGFAIERGGWLCREHRLIGPSGDVDLQRALDAVAKEYPGEWGSMLTARNILSQYGVTTVNIPPAKSVS